MKSPIYKKKNFHTAQFHSKPHFVTTPTLTPPNPCHVGSTCLNLLSRCGDTCCPNSILNPAQVTCCKTAGSCCIPGTSGATGTSSCDGGSTSCPFSLDSDSIFDVGGNIRDQCCARFRGGCCSENENDTLDLL